MAVEVGMVGPVWEYFSRTRVELKEELQFHWERAQAEALAISQACDLHESELAKGTELPAAISIYSDSQAVLRALNSRWIKSRVIQACIEKLNALGVWTSIQLC